MPSVGGAGHAARGDQGLPRQRAAGRRCTRSARSISRSGKGEFFAVVGPSGCGKSTLLELIAGLPPPTEGTIEFEGRPIADDIPDGIGVVFQEDACFPWLNVRDNIAFGLRKRDLDAERRARARRAPSSTMMGLARLRAQPIRRSCPAACASASASRARW